jgi:hypothetical protein
MLKKLIVVAAAVAAVGTVSPTEASARGGLGGGDFHGRGRPLHRWRGLSQWVIQRRDAAVSAMAPTTDILRL